MLLCLLSSETLKHLRWPSEFSGAIAPEKCRLGPLTQHSAEVGGRARRAQDAETSPVCDGEGRAIYSDIPLIRSHASSRVTSTPSTFAGGGVRIMRSPSKRTLRTCGAVKRAGSQLASTMVVSVLPSNV